MPPESMPPENRPPKKIPPETNSPGDPAIAPDIAPARTRPWGKLIVLIILIGALVFVFAPYPLAAIAQRMARSESYDVLVEATDRAAMDDAVGRLGIVLDVGDDDWIAIRYRDSHAHPGYSIAVALTSDGRWLESTVHYCAMFSVYDSMRKQAEAYPELAADDSFSSSHEWLRQADEAPSLDAALAVLQDNGFARTDHDVQAASVVK